jgi:phosphonate transport system permease protein
MATPTSTARPPRPDPQELPAGLRGLASPLRRPSAGTFAGLVAVVAVVAWSARGADFSPAGLASGVPDIAEFLARLWPPDFTQLGKIVSLLAETLQMAVIGTLLGALASLLLSLTAARNIAPRPLYLVSRFVLNVLRSIPELVFALMFVTAVGLGPFAGILALAIGVIGTMAKIFAEAIESIDPAPVEAMRAVGAGRAQTVVFAMLPQAMPMITAYTLMLWEGNVRHATILGLVGAGGIGLELTLAMRLYDFGHLLAIIICIVVLVTAIDRLSAFLRARLS